MTRFFSFLILVSFLTACGDSQTPPAAPGQTASDGIPTQVTSAQENELFDLRDDLGDLEQGINIQVTLEAADRPASAKVDELVDHRNDVSMATANLTAPFPEALWLTVRVKPNRSFPNPPAVVRLHIKRDDETLDTKAAVVGKMATGLDKAAEMTWRINALQGLTEMPDTMLIVAETEMLLMPAGTTEEVIDPMNADVAPSRRTVKPSNPLRINFLRVPGDTP